MTRRRRGGLATRRRLRQSLTQLSSPSLIAAVAAGALATVVFDRALAAVQESRRINAEMAVLAARVVAESAAAEYVGSGGAAARQVYDAGNGIEVRTGVEPLDTGGQALLTAEVGDLRLQWTFASLPGGTAPAFGRALTVADGVPVPGAWGEVARTEVDDLPRLAVGAADPAADALLLTPDPGIALLRLSAGTDRPDYVFTAARQPEARRVVASGVRVVDGNLWVDQGAVPLVLELVRDLTLIVRGNVYLGRSVRVLGPGHLTIACAADDGSAFFDRDGNGRWSTGDELVGGGEFRGPMEGAGAAVLGFAGGAAIELDIGLHVGGVLQLGAAPVQVHGPVVVCSGACAPAAAPPIAATGRRLPEVRRNVLPGFVAVGVPRPGPLRGLAREPLYPTAPPR